MNDESGLADLRHRVAAYVRKRTRDAELAEDLAQDVLLKLHAHRDDLPADPQRRTAWALRVARNAMIDHFRTSRSTNRPVELAAEEVRAAGADPVAQFASCVEPMVKQLPQAYRSAVELADLRQRPQHEVARALGISLSGAKSRVQRGRRHLRAMIDACCRVELGRRGSVVAVDPIPGGRRICGDSREAVESCVLSPPASSSVVEGRDGRGQDEEADYGEHS